ncbi:MAG TPA: hypothetical protein VM537_11590 [Anaerolineae bacterium]|nr:hypothetical protein [Anaerolineae bacterium]
MSSLEDTVRAALAASDVASLWSLVDTAPDGDTIETPESIDSKVLRRELFNLRDVAQAVFQESIDMVTRDEALEQAAVEYLGEAKAGVLLTLYGDNTEQLSEEAIVAAKLGTLKPRGASVRFAATEELLVGVRALAQLEKPACYEPASEEASTWDDACRLGWLDALPMEFYLTRLGPWESDTMLARRCIAVLQDLAKMFPDWRRP